MEIKYIVKSDVHDKHYLSKSNGSYCFKACFNVTDIEVFDTKEEAIAACEQAGGADFLSNRPIIVEVII